MTEPEDNQHELLKAAIAIGRNLCESAFWDKEGRQCNWMGRRDIVDDELTARFSVRSAALSPELYSGSAGVSLFLVELYGKTGDMLFLHTATAALNRSFLYMKSYPTPASPVSFFAGHLGILYTACRLLELYPGARLEQQIEWLMDEINKAMARPYPLDLITGCAGAIPALLSLSRRPGLNECEELAVGCGERLCQAAQWKGSKCMWESDVSPSAGLKLPPMTGFSHGASGIARSLLELYQCTGEVKFLNVARGAFAFEDSLFSRADCNWIDTRFPHSRENGVVTGRFQAAWCHGAPGISLSRMRARSLDRDNASHHEKMAKVAIQTTLSAIERGLQKPDQDATLCHGLTGLSEIVLTFSEMSNDDSYRRLATESATRLIQRYGETGKWPSGINAGGPSPSLMVGSAGIGHHFLRLQAFKEIPSVLIIIP